MVQTLCSSGRRSKDYCVGCTQTERPNGTVVAGRSVFYHTPPHNDAVSQQVAAIVVVVGLDSALVGHHLGVVGHGTLFYGTLFYEFRYNCLYRIYRVSETTTAIVLAIYRVAVVDNNWAAGEATKEAAAAAKLAVLATDGNVQ
jgi:hypothetical protein